MKTSVPLQAPPARILLVDDNRYGLEGRKTVLQELGHSIATAQSGEEALQLLSQEKFDLIVTDYKMSKMTGVDLIRCVRSLDPDARIILVSGFVEMLGLNEDTTGADVVIAKNSTEIGNLVRSVTRLLNRRPTRKPPASQRSTNPDKRKAGSSRPKALH